MELVHFIVHVVFFYLAVKKMQITDKMQNKQKEKS